MTTVTDLYARRAETWNKAKAFWMSAVTLRPAA